MDRPEAEILPESLDINEAKCQYLYRKDFAQSSAKQEPNAASGRERAEELL